MLSVDEINFISFFLPVHVPSSGNFQLPHSNGILPEEPINGLSVTTKRVFSRLCLQT